MWIDGAFLKHVQTKVSLRSANRLLSSGESGSNFATAANIALYGRIVDIRLPLGNRTEHHLFSDFPP